MKAQRESDRYTAPAELKVEGEPVSDVVQRVVDYGTASAEDRRYELAARILANWRLEEIVNQPAYPMGVARLALDLAQALVGEAIERGLLADAD